MDQRIQKAIKEIKALLGANSVVNYDHYSGHFQINTEVSPMVGIHLDYFEKYDGSDELNDILEQAGIYLEWEDSSVASAHDD